MENVFFHSLEIFRKNQDQLLCNEFKQRERERETERQRDRERRLLQILQVNSNLFADIG